MPVKENRFRKYQLPWLERSRAHVGRGASWVGGGIRPESRRALRDWTPGGKSAAVVTLVGAGGRAASLGSPGWLNTGPAPAKAWCPAPEEVKVVVPEVDDEVEVTTPPTIRGHRKKNITTAVKKEQSAPWTPGLGVLHNPKPEVVDEDDLGRNSRSGFNFHCK